MTTWPNFCTQQDPWSGYQEPSPTSYEETVGLIPLKPRNVEHFSEGKNRERASNTTGVHKQVQRAIRRLTTIPPKNYVQCRAYRLEVGKGECDGVQLGSRGRDGTDLHSEEH